MVTESTALLLAHLHRERDATKKLITECEEQQKKCDDITWEKHFGDPRERPNQNKGRYLEIRIPSGDGSAYCPRMVQPALGLSILRAHLADVQAKIIAANEMVRVELDTPSAEPLA